MKVYDTLNLSKLSYHCLAVEAKPVIDFLRNFFVVKLDVFEFVCVDAPFKFLHFGRLKDLILIFIKKYLPTEIKVKIKVFYKESESFHAML